MKRYSKLFFIFYFFILSSATVYAQPPQAGETFWDRVYFGGNIGLQFGSQTLVDINPLAGYRLTERLSLGLSVTYLYYSYNDPYSNYNYSSNIYGGSIFTNYFIFENIFAHIEGEVLNMEVPNNFLHRMVRDNIFGFYVGGGYRQPLGDRSSMNILILYNLNEDIYSPYQNPIIRIGFGFGI
jgi:hypothetical protein